MRRLRYAHARRRCRFTRPSYAVSGRLESSERSRSCSYFHVSPINWRAMVCVMRPRAWRLLTRMQTHAGTNLRGRQARRCLDSSEVTSNGADGRRIRWRTARANTSVLRSERAPTRVPSHSRDQTSSALQTQVRCSCAARSCAARRVAARSARGRPGASPRTRARVPPRARTRRVDSLRGALRTANVQRRDRERPNLTASAPRWSRVKGSRARSNDARALGLTQSQISSAARRTPWEANAGCSANRP